MHTRFTLTVSLVVAALSLRPAPLAAQAKGASAAAPICKDGTTSKVSGSGACSGHQGVDSLATAAAKKSAKAAKAEAKLEKSKTAADPQKARIAEAKAKKAEAKAEKAEDKAAKDAAGATAQCKDGTYSHATTLKGACTRHGGVAKSLKP